jgi:hypothetical protein
VLLCSQHQRSHINHSARLDKGQVIQPLVLLHTPHKSLSN